MPTPVEVYVDYVCPFCFLADNALSELKRHRDVEIQTKPFELRPDPVPTLRPEDDYLPRIWSDSVYPMAARLGIDIRLPTISPQPRTELAFIGLQIAEEHDLAPEYNTSVFSAFFQHDRDIGDENVLVSIASSLSIDPDTMARELMSDTRRDRQRMSQHHAASSLGISAVPTIVIDNHLLQGVPNPRRLLNAFDRIVANNHNRKD